jgi:hypothetical protein
MKKKDVIHWLEKLRERIGEAENFGEYERGFSNALAAALILIKSEKVFSKSDDEFLNNLNKKN